MMDFDSLVFFHWNYILDLFWNQGSRQNGVDEKKQKHLSH